MANQRLVRANLGYLNVAQDATNIKEFEAAELSALDADQIALQTLSNSDYFNTVQGTAGLPNTQAATVGKTDFRISGGNLQYEATSGWLAFNTVFGSDSPTVVVGLSDQNVASAQITDDMSTKLTAVAVDATADFTLNIPDDYIDIEVTAISADVDPTVDIRYRTTANGWATLTVTKGVSTLLISGVSVTLASGVAYATTDEGRVETSADDLPDGDYAYKGYRRAKDGGVYESAGGELPYIAPSDATKITIKNFDDLGERVKARVPEVTLFTPGANYEEKLFRRDEGENDYFEVDLTKITNISGSTYLDTLRIVEMDTLKPLDIADENESEINDAIGNASNQYAMIFSKDNRLFRVPEDRKDLILYSRPGAWWGWQRENSFALDADIVAFRDVRDPTTVGGTLTTVIFTTDGIYHLTGSGTEGDPYNLNKQIDNITVEANSIVNLNGTLMFVSKSTSGAYNEGNYGQKVFEYNLQTLTEVSARIQTNTTLLSTNAIEYGEMLGGDKYAFKKTGIDELLIYHRDAQGWISTTAAEETANTWTWKSKNFTPSVMERFKLGYARKFKLDFQGTVTVTFNVWYKDPSDVQTYTVDFESTGRTEVFNHLPHIKGSVWNFEVAGDNATLYNMWMVS